MPSVYVARRIMPGPLGELAESFELEAHDSEWPPTREQVLAASAGRDGLLLMSNDAVDDELSTPRARSSASSQTTRLATITSISTPRAAVESSSPTRPASSPAPLRN
jgi:hypothetical protein